ncbi:hypothetical protein UY3_06654 [Chelonia mydas]|uniref:Uncharacterized protein n=1 Tax=Chelonia mydas TaxID=8469 RepID=M7BKB0_CHEMY|nr:hypothetical protein UY3_06654 [Chelonia mydas]
MGMRSRCLGRGQRAELLRPPAEKRTHCWPLLRLSVVSERCEFPVIPPRYVNSVEPDSGQEPLFSDQTDCRLIHYCQQDVTVPSEKSVLEMTDEIELGTPHNTTEGAIASVFHNCNSSYSTPGGEQVLDEGQDVTLVTRDTMPQEQLQHILDAYVEALYGDSSGEQTMAEPASEQVLKLEPELLNQMQRNLSLDIILIFANRHIYISV